MIPKIIHYCWFGRGEKPELVQRCIQSWRKFCPDYEIVEWNENNFNTSCNRWCKEAYEFKKWAFVSDYARLKAVYDHGGIYLDTDVELKSVLPKELLKNKSFFFFEGIRNINTGFGFGAERKIYILEALMSDYNTRSYIHEGAANTEINTARMLKELPWLKRDGTHQEKDDIVIYSEKEFVKFAEHHTMLSWNDDRYVVELCKKNSAKYRRIISILRNPKIMQMLEQNGEMKLSRLYIIFAYDFWDYGPIYFIGRLLKRLLRKSCI